MLHNQSFAYEIEIRQFSRSLENKNSWRQNSQKLKEKCKNQLIIGT